MFRKYEVTMDIIPRSVSSYRLAYTENDRGVHNPSQWRIASKQLNLESISSALNSP